MHTDREVQKKLIAWFEAEHISPAEAVSAMIDMLGVILARRARSRQDMATAIKLAQASIEEAAIAVFPALHQ